MLSTDHTHGLTSAYWPGDRSEPVLDQTIGEALREAASRYGSRTALIDGTPEPNRRQWSFNDVLETAERAARALLTRFTPGEIRLTGPDPLDPVQIDANTLDDPADLKALVKAVELCREIGNSAALRPFAKREVMPGQLKGFELENFIRDGIATVWHQACTAKMGGDPMSVVDHQLKVYGIENLRIADASVMPPVTTGNTMAPCVVIGERCGELVRRTHRI